MGEGDTFGVSDTAFCAIVEQRLRGDLEMKEPGLDGRHRDEAPPNEGRIQQKRGDTLNKNLPRPILEFSPLAKLATMRRETGQTSVDAVTKAAKNRK